MEAADTCLAQQADDAQFAIVDSEPQAVPAERKLVLDLEQPDILIVHEDTVEVPDRPEPRLDAVIEKQPGQDHARAKLIAIGVGEESPEADLLPVAVADGCSHLHGARIALRQFAHDNSQRAARAAKVTVFPFRGRERACHWIELDEPCPEPAFESGQVSAQPILLLPDPDERMPPVWLPAGVDDRRFQIECNCTRQCFRHDIDDLVEQVFDDQPLGELVFVLRKDLGTQIAIREIKILQLPLGCIHPPRICMPRALSTP